MATTAVEHRADETDAGGRKRVVLGGLLLGIGFGGFVDGIVLHQILQWHHMLSSDAAYPPTTIAGLEANTVADGLFHALCWISALTGLWLLWPARRTPLARPGLLLGGLLLAGWGTFNLVEGTIDHHLLEVHHVKEGAGRVPLDLGFLALGALLLVGGLALARRGERSAEA